MSKSAFIFRHAFLLWLSYSGCLYAQQGYLRLISHHPKLTVLLNDSLIRAQVNQPMPLKCGIYQLTVLHPQKGMWKSDDWVTPVRILPDDTTTVNPRFASSLIIQSSPFGANVHLNDQFMGEAPLYLDDSDSLDGILLISKDNYKPHRLQLNTIGSSTLRVTLEPIINGTVFNDPHSSKIKRTKKLTCGLMALTLCSGFMTAYFNHQAEVCYERYLTAGHPQDMQRHYDNSRRFDTYSRISLGAFEVCFVLCFYALIR